MITTTNRDFFVQLVRTRENLDIKSIVVKTTAIVAAPRKQASLELRILAEDIRKAQTIILALKAKNTYPPEIINSLQAKLLGLKTLLDRKMA